MVQVAVIGGGFSGLASAHELERRLGDSARMTLFEASDRLGGKIRTCEFGAAGLQYESGVAECYDFSSFGRDPLAELVRTLGLSTVPLEGGTVVVDGTILADDAAVGRVHGPRTLASIQAFRRRARREVGAAAWYGGFTSAHNTHAWASRSGEDVLSLIPCPLARRHVRITMHADLATEPHLVNGLVAWRNVLKSVPGVGAQYHIEGGMEQLPRRLAARLARTQVRLRAPVARVARRTHGRFEVNAVAPDGTTRLPQVFDAVVVALPYATLRRIEWAGVDMAAAMARHAAHYDHPAHYLRVTALFDAPVWRRWIRGSYFMLDAFDGCCVYDVPGPGSAGPAALGWLLAGEAARRHAAESEGALVERMLASLPARMAAEARPRFLEARVHRWPSALCGQPGGLWLRDPLAAHRPLPQCPGLAVAGDYLFDSTLNGALRSASIAAGIVEQAVAPRHRRATAIELGAATRPPIPATRGQENNRSICQA
ncbi:MAG: NAD(P)/FAD-dependent oxidoreductase [Vicinamibacterales bacterium]